MAAMAKAKTLSLNKLRKRLSSLTSDELSDEALAKFEKLAAEVDNDKRLARAAQDVGVLAAAAADGCPKLVEWLLERGVEPDAPPRDAMRAAMDAPALSATLELAGDTPAEDLARIVKALLAAGADPERLHPDPERVQTDDRKTSLDFAVSSRQTAAVELLLDAHEFGEGARVSAMISAIHTGRDRKPESLAMVELLLARGFPVEGVGRFEITASHAAALACNLELAKRVFEAGAPLDVALAQEVAYMDHDFAPPGGGVIPRLPLPEGTTPLDAATRMRALLAKSRDAHLAVTDPKGENFAKFRAGQLEPRVGEIEAVVAWLGERGAPSGDVREHRPEHCVRVDEALRELVGAEALADATRLLDVKGLGPWGYLFRVAKALGDPLVEAVTPAADAGQILAFMIAGRHLGRSVALLGDPMYRRGTLFGPADVTVHPERYPEVAWPVLRQDVLVGLRGDAVLALEKPESDEEGVAHLWEVSEEEAVDHGDLWALLADLSGAPPS